MSNYTVQAPQIESPLNRLAKFQQVRSGQMQLDQAENAMAATNAVNQAWQESGGDVNKLRQSLINRGQGSQVPALEKMLADTAKSKAGAQTADTKNVTERMALSRQALETIDPRDPQAPQKYMQWNMANFSDPVLGGWLKSRGVTPEKSMQQVQASLGKPGGFEQMLMQSKLGIEKSMEMVLKQQNATATADYRSGQLALGERRATAAERSASSMEGYRNEQLELGKRRAAAAEKRADASTKVAESKAAQGTVSQQQAAYNAKRILDAANEIASVTKKNPDALAPGASEAMSRSVGAEGAANVARDADRQIVYGAQRDALDAVLYLATGAAYNKEQLEGAWQSYMPAYTDKDEARAAKQQRLGRLIESAKIRAGAAWTPEMDAAMQSLTGGGGTPPSDDGWTDL
jgi:chorismate mutase